MSQRYIRDTDLEKILALGMRVYTMSKNSLVIRQLQPDLSWRVIRRRRVRHKIEKDFDKILQDSMAIGV